MSTPITDFCGRLRLPVACEMLNGTLCHSPGMAGPACDCKPRQLHLRNSGVVCNLRHRLFVASSMAQESIQQAITASRWTAFGGRMLLYTWMRLSNEPLWRKDGHIFAASCKFMCLCQCRCSCQHMKGRLLGMDTVQLNDTRFSVADSVRQRVELPVLKLERIVSPASALLALDQPRLEATGLLYASVKQSSWNRQLGCSCTRPGGGGGGIFDVSCYCLSSYFVPGSLPAALGGGKCCNASWNRRNC